MEKINLPNLNTCEFYFPRHGCASHIGCRGLLVGEAEKISPGNLGVSYWRQSRTNQRLACVGCGRGVGRKATRLIKRFGVAMPERTSITYLEPVATEWKIVYYRMEDVEDAEEDPAGL